MSHKQCQIQCLKTIHRPLSRGQILFQRLKRIRSALGRRWKYLYNFLHAHTLAGRETACCGIQTSKAEALQSGDLVRVRSKEEIRATLDNWNQRRGCAFLDEMWVYCGTQQRVLKRVERFLDERDYLTKRCKGIVLLEGLICEGTKYFGPCDRSCFYFWREEWLKKIDDTPPTPPSSCE